MSVLLEFNCPRCQYHVDEASVAGPDGHAIRPQAGDIGLCLQCAAPLQYRVAMPPKWLTYDDVKDLDREDRAQMTGVMWMILTLRRPQGGART